VTHLSGGAPTAMMSCAGTWRYSRDLVSRSADV